MEIRIGLFRQFESGLALRSLHVNKVSQFFTEIGISEFRVFRVFRQIERSLAVSSFNVNKVSKFFPMSPIIPSGK